MSLDNLQVLKTFTRKLANCRYKVTLNNLIKYMDEGRFGYTVEDGIETVITNDLVFADDIATLINHLRAIFKEPHIFLKKEELIQNVAVASKMDNESLRLNYKDDKLWRIKDGETALEYAHAYVHEDNLAIYENRFITALIDIVNDVVKKKLSDLVAELETLNRKISGMDLIGLTAKEYVDYSDACNGLPVLLSIKQPLVNAIASLIKSKKQLSILMSRDLYKACKKAKPFNFLNLIATNILQHDKEYNYCYLFYINYLNRDPIITSERKMYYGFVEVNLFKALVDLGFTPSEDTQEVLINNSAHLKFEKLDFIKEPFTVTITQKSEDEIGVTVTETADGNVGNYILKVVDKTLAEKLDNFESPDAFAKKLVEEQDEAVMGTFLITNIEGATEQNVYTVQPVLSNTIPTLKFLLKSTMLIVEGAGSIHSRYCPLCGSRLVSPEETDFTCNACEAQYHIFSYSLKDIVWIKRLPRIIALDADRSGINTNDEDGIKDLIEEAKAVIEEPTPATTEEVVEAPAKTTATEEVVATTDEENEGTTSLKKSFVAKMCGASDEVKDFYNQFKQHLLSYKKVYSRTSWNSDTFSSGRLPRIKLAVRGKTLVAFYALNPSEYVDTKYFAKDMSDTKKYEATPTMVKIKSERGLKRAMELADILFGSLELVKKKDYIPENYEFPAKTDEELIDEGLAKYVTINL
ncbi:MAG: hypothetical protein IJY57_04340 [Clostridia bacterium]|nr:hypothetical protein [Clostridia bacterium]